MSTSERGTYWHRLESSFGALYCAFESPRVARWTLAVLLTIHTVLLAYSAYVHSPTLNEPGHLVAGLSYWKFGRFDVYSVNPPLVKMVAALPVMAVGYNEDWTGFNSGPGARPEMGMGENFVAANGERSFFLFMIARWVCIPFSWLGAIICYLWARDLYGRPSGVFAAVIWCFEPNILAHASLITSDAAGTALGLAACYTFWRWLKQPIWSQAALTGVVLGLAELCKTTLILFYPLWPLMWLIYRLATPNSSSSGRGQGEGTFCGMPLRDWLREAGMLALRMVIGLYVLNVGYGFEGSFKQLNELHFVSDLFTGNVPDEKPSTSGRGQGEGASNRFADSWLGNLPVPFPKHYVVGIDIQQRDFEHFGRPSYLRGEWRDHGWCYYYLYAVAIKVPVGLWILAVIALIARLRNEPDYRDEFILLFPAIVIFTVVSSKTGFSEHMRYVLPTFPYLFIAISRVATLLRPNSEKLAVSCLTSPAAIVYKYFPPAGGTISPLVHRSHCVSFFRVITVVGCLLWLFASSLWIYPHNLSYFNETVGGPLNGTSHLLGSNVDWGQDLRYLGSFLSESPNELGDRRVFLAYFGFINPSDIGITKVHSWSESDVQRSIRSPTASESKTLQYADDVYAISLNLLHGYPWAARGSSSRSPRKLIPILTAFQDTPVFKRVGYSIIIYRR